MKNSKDMTREEIVKEIETRAGLPCYDDETTEELREFYEFFLMPYSKSRKVKNNDEKS